MDVSPLKQPSISRCNMKWLESIGEALSNFFSWLKQSQDPEVRKKNRLEKIDKKIFSLQGDRHDLIEKLKFENDYDKRQKISMRIADISDQLHRLRVEKEKLQS